jgi:putative transposase
MRTRSVDHLVAHVVWAVSHRRPLLAPEHDARLGALFAAKAHDVDAQLLAVGFASDHTHVLVRFAAKRSLAEVVQRIKGGSARALGLQSPELVFSWQDGYWARSCDPDDLGEVTAYVLDQRTHHRDGVKCEPWEDALASNALG